jgi:hydrophobic/amphiphilic exporter-1 (mainly G- bacteria), HAE1 family
MLDAWFARRMTILSVLLILVVCVAALLPSVQFGPSRSVGAVVFTVTIEYFGVDAEEMERRISMPLEEAVSPLPGIQRLRATSEYGKSIVEVTLSPSTDADRFSLSLRDAVHSLSAALPKAAQRPVIQSTASGQRPFFIAAVSLEGATLDETRDRVETLVKPSIERIDGVGDVEVGGGSQREVHVIVDMARAAAAGLSFTGLASLLQAHALSRPVGRLRGAAVDTPLILDSRLGSLEQLERLPLARGDGGAIPLGQIAEVRYAGREQETISRTDQERRVTVYVTCAGTANVVAVSAALRRKLDALSSDGLSFRVVYDLGGRIGDSLNEVLQSLAVAMALVAVFVGVVLRPPRNAVLLALLLPFTGCATAAILSALGFGVDGNILAGIGVGIGSVADPGIIVLSALTGKPCASARRSTGDTVRELIAPLTASTATTIIVLVPLLYMGRSVAGLTEVSYSLSIMIGLSILLALFILPAFAARSGAAARAAVAGEGALRAFGRVPPETRRRILRRTRRAADRAVSWAAAHPRAVLCGAAALCALGVLTVLRMDLSLGAPADARSLFAHVEFESGTRIEVIDERTAWLARQIGAMRGVVHVQSTARRESAELTVTLEGTPDDAARVRAACISLGAQIPDAFVYLPEGESGTDQAVEVSILGPETERLRALARETAAGLRGQPWVSQVVLHFKEGPPAYVLDLDHDALGGYGLSAAAVAGTLRWSMYGPVALKWLEPDSREIDLRVRSSLAEHRDLAAITRTVIPASDGRVVPLERLGTFRLTRPPSRLFRTERQRTVSLTAHSGVRNTAAVLKDLEAYLASVPLPPGYAYRIDPLLYDRLRQLRTLSLLLAAALLLVFITLAAQMESLSSPLLVIAIVPVSLSLPLLFLMLAGNGIDVPVIVSLIIMTGMIVNNAILVLDRTLARCADLDSFSPGEVRRSLRYAVRQRTRALFLTSATTILGVVPFLLGSSSGPELFRPLAMVACWGTLASVAATFLVLPAIAVAAPVFVRRFPMVRR